jgi:Fe-Mn family superoxide dismutase
MNAASRAIKNAPGPNTPWAKHALPRLPYDYYALEPHIDAKTMMLHHDHHHASNVATLNSALQEYPKLHRLSASWLLLNTGKLPRKIRTVVRHNAGGHVNHSLFWKAMSPPGRGPSGPAGALAEAIDRDFGSFDQFKRHFIEACERQLGSGWVWLSHSRLDDDRLRICATSGHGTPLSYGDFPILLNDVWEHAYYLNYQERCGDYLRAWWSIVNWDEAANRFDRSSAHAAERNWEDDGGRVRSVTT